jgi:hypothetical protein
MQYQHLFERLACAESRPIVVSVEYQLRPPACPLSVLLLVVNGSRKLTSCWLWLQAIIAMVAAQKTSWGVCGAG